MKADSRSAVPRLATSSAGLPTASTRPACISEMRSQRSASFMKWVEMKMVTPSRRDSSPIASQKPSRATGSTPEVGSSRISISGLWIMATASDKRWRTPSGSASGSLSITSSSPKRFAMSIARPGISLSGTSKSRACSTRFWRTVSSV